MARAVGVLIELGGDRVLDTARRSDLQPLLERCLGRLHPIFESQLGAEKFTNSCEPALQLGGQRGCDLGSFRRRFGRLTVGRRSGFDWLTVAGGGFLFGERSLLPACPGRLFAENALESFDRLRQLLAAVARARTGLEWIRVVGGARWTRAPVLGVWFGSHGAHPDRRSDRTRGKRRLRYDDEPKAEEANHEAPGDAHGGGN